MGKKNKNKNTRPIDREIRAAQDRILRLTDHIQMLQAQRAKIAARKQAQVIPQDLSKFDYVIEFDGGTSCNIPAIGYGEGYGSYKINDEEIKRVKFGVGHSNNSSEILTLVAALNELVERNTEDCSHISVMCRGDSKIALKWANPNLKSAPSEATSMAFRESIKEMRKVNCLFGIIKTEWRGRLHSVAMFGH